MRSSSLDTLKYVLRLNRPGFLLFRLFPPTFYIRIPTLHPVDAGLLMGSGRSTAVSRE